MLLLTTTTTASELSGLDGDVMGISSWLKAQSKLVKLDLLPGQLPCDELGQKERVRD